MNTAFLLMAQYGGKAVIPVEQVCKDYFSHLSTNKLIQKLALGEIPIPLVRIEVSQKSAKGIYLVDLSNYLDTRIAAAKKELTAMTRWWRSALAPRKPQSSRWLTSSSPPPPKRQCSSCPLQFKLNALSRAANTNHH